MDGRVSVHNVFIDGGPIFQLRAFIAVHQVERDVVPGAFLQAFQRVSMSR